MKPISALFVAVAIFASAGASALDDIIGTWTGTMDAEDGTIPIPVIFEFQEGGRVYMLFTENPTPEAYPEGQHFDYTLRDYKVVISGDVDFGDTLLALEADLEVMSKTHANSGPRWRYMEGRLGDRNTKIHNKLNLERSVPQQTLGDSNTGIQNTLDSERSIPQKTLANNMVETSVETIFTMGMLFLILAVVALLGKLFAKKPRDNPQDQAEEDSDEIKDKIKLEEASEELRRAQEEVRKIEEEIDKKTNAQVPDGERPSFPSWSLQLLDKQDWNLEDAVDQYIEEFDLLPPVDKVGSPTRQRISLRQAQAKARQSVLEPSRDELLEMMTPHLDKPVAEVESLLDSYIFSQRSVALLYTQGAWYDINTDELPEGPGR